MQRKQLARERWVDRQRAAGQLITTVARGYLARRRSRPRAAGALRGDPGGVYRGQENVCKAVRSIFKNSRKFDKIWQKTLTSVNYMGSRAIPAGVREQIDDKLQIFYT